MSFEWARARAIENRRQERARACSVLGAEAPEIDMLYPVEVTFWGERRSPIEATDPLGDSHPTKMSPTDGMPDPSYLPGSEGSNST